jgi:Polyketide cyclase / dehydrase and lipid transport
VDDRTQTSSMETAAGPASVVALLADATRIPGWAPAFADTVSSAGGSGWRAVKDGRDFMFRTAVSLDASTVDYLREIAPGREGGAYLRVVPRPGGGSVVVMTLPVPSGADPVAVASTLEDELAALKRLAEGG